VVIGAGRPTRELVAVWAACLDYHLWG